MTKVAKAARAKLTMTLQIPEGATFIASDDDSLHNKDRRAIFESLRGVGNKGADNLIKK